MPLQERDANAPLKKLQSHSTPQPHSKLPRPVVATPTSERAQSTTTWTPRSARQAQSTGKITTDLRKDALRKRDSVVIRSYQKQKTAPAAVDKPLPGDKPLPARPIVRLSNVLSPSKDSRCLVDASEAPLRIQTSTGDKSEWPPLEPRSASATPTAKAVISGAASQLTLTPCTSLLNPIPVYADKVDSGSTRLEPVTAQEPDGEDKQHINTHSSASSYASAPDGVQMPAALKASAELEPQGDIDVTTSYPHSVRPATDDLATRKSSDQSLESGNTFNTPSTRSLRDYASFTNFSRKVTEMPSSSSSRQHSPSPASFSRPRPQSFFGNGARPYSMRTASRIPIVDSTKATVIDVKRSIQSAASLSKSSLPPTFGTRRLALPEALQILENGKLKRRMKQSEADVGECDSQRDRSYTLESDISTTTAATTPSLSFSLTSAPENAWWSSSNGIRAGGWDCNSPNESLPHASELLQEQHSQGAAPSQPAPQSRDEEDGQSLNENFDDVLPYYANAPPTTSTHASPLPTIHSEVALSANVAYSDSGDGGELDRALSRLEGKGTPPKTSIDQHALLQMFGNVKRAFETSAPTSTTFAENVATAEKYLAQQHSQSANEHERQRNGAGILGQTPISINKEHTVVSKWSESSPSDKELSPLAQGSHTEREAAAEQRRQDVTNTISLENSLSIGYPAVIPTSGTTPNLSSSDETAASPTVARRQSSPTFSVPKGKKNVPGSVSRARERAQIAGFARTTASAESKRAPKPPTPNNKICEPETVSRGRKSSPHLHRSASNAAMKGVKTPRSRSRSRYVLDKINGLFSGKRDKKRSDTPPVPRLELDTSNFTVTGASGTRSSARHSPRSSPRGERLAGAPSGPTASQNRPQGTDSPEDAALTDGLTLHNDSNSVLDLSEHLLISAKREVNPHRKQRMLNFAKVLNDSLISVREAQISAETAQQAARSAELYFGMTQKSLDMLQKLAVSVARRGAYARR